MAIIIMGSKVMMAGTGTVVEIGENAVAPGAFLQCGPHLQTVWIWTGRCPQCLQSSALDTWIDVADSSSNRKVQGGAY